MQWKGVERGFNGIANVRHVHRSFPLSLFIEKVFNNVKPREADNVKVFIFY